MFLRKLQIRNWKQIPGNKSLPESEFTPAWEALQCDQKDKLKHYQEMSRKRNAEQVNGSGAKLNEQQRGAVGTSFPL
ncbi:hypothetical protein PQX77_008151 [Marasmius sp. AFHP31]|nr:hypothetical protein PQX77_008151 [Marasmius sp. AFHP31]